MKRHPTRGGSPLEALAWQPGQYRLGLQSTTRTPSIVVTWLKGPVWTVAPCAVSQASTWASASTGSPHAADQRIYSPYNLANFFFQSWDHLGVARSGTPLSPGHGPPPRA